MCCMCDVCVSVCCVCDVSVRVSCSLLQQQRMHTCVGVCVWVYVCVCMSVRQCCVCDVCVRVSCSFLQQHRMPQLAPFFPFHSYDSHQLRMKLHLHHTYIYDYLYSNLYSHLLHITYIWITTFIFIFHVGLFVFAALFLSLIYISLSQYVCTTISILICGLFPSTATKLQLAPFVPLHQIRVVCPSIHHFGVYKYSSFVTISTCLLILYLHIKYESYYRVAKTHRMPYLWRSFSAEEPYNQWLFCEKRPAT